jgi:hypothetical protein
MPSLQCERGSFPVTDESISRGLKLELMSSKGIYKVGELPAFTAVISNISFEKITLCTYKIAHRLLSGLFADNYRVYQFGSTVEEQLKNEDFKILEAGEKLMVELNLPQEKDYHFLYSGKLPPIVTEEMIHSDFPPGNYSFCIFLGPHVAFFVANDGTFMHQRIIRHVLNEVERAPDLSVNSASVWDGALTAFAHVKYVE